MKKTIGILGGMGPLATADLFRKIIDNTQAGCDQDHLRVVIDSNTNIPDRTAAILHGGEDPVREMVRSGLALEGMGADLLIMPCNTAHYFYDRIAPFFNIPLLNMLEETAGEIQRRGISTVGLLATDGTIQAGVYDKPLASRGIQVLKPSPEGQQRVMEVNYQGVKAGNYRLDISGFLKVLDGLFVQGAQVVILGCTELPVAFDRFAIHRPHIDPTLVLARAAIREAGGQWKKG